jgi:hypothetical protein
MIELIYLDNGKDYYEVKDILLKEYPFAKIKDASDEIHEYRFEFDAPIAQSTFCRFAILNGFARNMLGFGIMMYEKEKCILIRKWLAQVEKLSERRKNERTRL